MKRVYPAPLDLDHDELKKFYNKKIVLWNQNYKYVNLPIACVAGIVYGAYSDRNGRKLPLLIGFISVLLNNSIYMLVWSEKTDIPLQWLFLNATVVGILGDFMLVMSCVNAYLADQFGDKRTLSIRMIVVSMIFSFGSLCGSQTVDQLVNFIGEFGTLFIVQGVLIGTYTRLDPFKWDTKEYAIYKTVRPIAPPGSLHGLLNPLTYTFITSLVTPTEIGQTFAISTIAGKIAGIVQTAVLQTIYTHTVDWYKGFVWILMFVISSLAAFLYFGVHIVAKREQIGT